MSYLMVNLAESARAQAQALVEAALPDGLTVRGNVGPSRGKDNGDFSSNHALVGAKLAQPAVEDVKPDENTGDKKKSRKAAQELEEKRTREFAEAICSAINLEGSYFSSVEAASKGFINFTLSERYYSELLHAIVESGEDYGRIDIGKGERVMIEFVSANPTGPMTIGNARGGVLGDSLASILDRAGYDVWREFYINDEGNQIEKFGYSIEARYMQIILGEDGFPFPEDGYHGDDIRDLAQIIYSRDGTIYCDMDSETRRRAFIEFALPYNIDLMREHLERYRISYDRWFPESELYKSGAVADTIALLENAGLTFERDGAIWLRNTDFGADKDEVLRRANGHYTYYASDIAYHRNKFIERGFDRVIDVLGADHHGHSIRFKATVSAPALGLADKRLDFLIMQMVRLERDGEVVKVSKRTGKALTLSDLLDEIGIDACRFFFNAKPDSHLKFDLDLAIRQDSENPVYYVQYAHARLCSLIAALAEEGISPKAPSEIDVGLLSTPYELELMKQLATLPESIRLAAEEMDPSHINRFLTELAGSFHRFYTFCRIKDEATELLNARLLLCDCTRRVLAIALGLIGVSAPVQM